jgi:hypothetical protein
MSEAIDTNELVVRQLAAALQDCLETAAETGHNLPEMLREALEELAVTYRSVEALVAQRPGSWEAEHVRQLAAGAEYLFDEALREEATALGHRITYDRDTAGAVSCRCTCGWPHNTEPPWDQHLLDDMAHVRQVVEEHLQITAMPLGHVPIWSPGEPVSCSCGWPNALEAGGATILDHFRRMIAAPPPPSPGERAAELARRYGAQGEEAKA